MQPQVEIKGRLPDGPGYRGELLRRPFVGKWLNLELTVTNTGTVTLATIPAGHLVVLVAARIVTVLNGTTPVVDLGDGTTADLFFDNTEIDEEAANDAGVHLVQSGYLASDTTVVATVGGATVTQGKVQFSMLLLDLSHMLRKPDYKATLT